MKKLLAFLAIFSAAQCACQGSPPSKSEVKEEHKAHFKPAAASDQSRKGESIFRTLNCMACHQVRGVGGDLGPALDGVGGRRSRDFLLMRLSNDPEEVEKFARVPGVSAVQVHSHTRISRQSTEAIVDFLETLPDPPEGFAVYPHVSNFPAEKTEENPQYKPAAMTSVGERGKHLFVQYGCVACHAVGEVGGWAGPALDGIGGKHSRAYIAAHISNPAEANAITPTKMPPFKLDEHDKSALVDYLLTLPNAQSKPLSK